MLRLTLWAEHLSRCIRGKVAAEPLPVAGYRDLGKPLAMGVHRLVGDRHRVRKRDIHRQVGHMPVGVHKADRMDSLSLKVLVVNIWPLRQRMALRAGISKLKRIGKRVRDRLRGLIAIDTHVRSYGILIAAFRIGFEMTSAYSQAWHRSDCT